MLGKFSKLPCPISRACEHQTNHTLSVLGIFGKQCVTSGRMHTGPVNSILRPSRADCKIE